MDIAGYNNNFDPPVSVTDGSSYGVPYNITKTLQHTANAFEEDRKKAIKAGMNAHIAKPISVDIILENLERMRQSVSENSDTF